MKELPCEVEHEQKWSAQAIDSVVSHIIYHWCASASPLLTPSLYGRIPYNEEIGEKSPTLVYGWLEAMCGYKQKWTVATLKQW